MIPFLQIMRSIYLLAAALAFSSVVTISPLRADPASPAGPPRTFSSLGGSVKALVSATTAGDRATVAAIFGPDVKDVLSGDPKQDTSSSPRLPSWSRSSPNWSRRLMIVSCSILGSELAVPHPLVKKEGVWFFDAAAGKEEIVNRRIGETSSSPWSLPDLSRGPA